MTLWPKRVLYRKCVICDDRIGVALDCGIGGCNMEGVDFHYHCDEINDIRCHEYQSDLCSTEGCEPMKVYADGSGEPG